MLTSARLRALEKEPYTQKEAEEAIGLTTDNGKRKPSILTVIEQQTANLDIEMSK